MSSLNISALQLDLAWHDPASNYAKVEALLAKESLVGELIVLPEMFTTAFSMEAATQAEQMQGPSVSWMHQLASRYESCVVGSLMIEEGGTYFNRFIAMTQDGILAQYDKRHPFSLANEHLTYKPGEKQVIFTYKGWNICPQICYDLRFPVWARNRRTADDQLSYDLLLYVANWPEARVRHWESLLVARAIENQSCVVGVNRVGLDAKELRYSGSSMILSAMGERLAFNGGSECVLTAELKKTELEAYRREFRFWQDADEFDVKGLRLPSAI